MKNEVFITIAGIALILFLFLAGQAGGMTVVAFAFILYNAYCAYYYKGMKSMLLASVPVLIFAGFMYVASIDDTLANIMVFVWLASMVFFAMNVETTKPEENSEPINTGKFCSNCGLPVEIDAAFCKSCGGKL